MSGSLFAGGSFAEASSVRTTLLRKSDTVGEDRRVQVAVCDHELVNIGNASSFRALLTDFDSGVVTGHLVF